MRLYKLCNLKWLRKNGFCLTYTTFCSQSKAVYITTPIFYVNAGEILDADFKPIDYKPINKNDTRTLRTV